MVICDLLLEKLLNIRCIYDVKILLTVQVKMTAWCIGAKAVFSNIVKTFATLY